jgi:hypothetical protein
MTTVTLLHLPDEERARQAFIFDHDQLHRHKTPTYILDPLIDPNWPGSKWHQDHQIAQNKLGTGSFILRDTNLANANERAWWEFANHLEHYISG